MKKIVDGEGYRPWHEAMSGGHAAAQRVAGLARASRRRGLGWAIALLAAVQPAWAIEWVPNETLVTEQADLIDMEFSQSRAQFCWNDEIGNLWIGNVDRSTGDFLPRNGRGILVDPDSMRFEDASKTKNGPEWVMTAEGDLIVYTKYAGRHTDGNSRIGIGRQAPDGTWYGGFLGPDVVRKAPYGSATEGDPAARITYVDNRENHFWRELGRPDSEQAIPDFPASNYPIRHVRGARAVTYPRNVDGVEQMFYRDFDTGVVEQLTSDSGNKYEIWMWRAPEFNNELTFMTLVDDVELRVYRKTSPPGGGDPQWTVIYSKRAPLGNKIFSPEPFIYNGRSYVFMAMSVKPNKFRSEIWISNVDAAAPIFKRITDNSLLRTRTDPEVFITDQGPRIYYNRLEPDTGSGRPRPCRNPACSDGVYRADPGLPAN